MSSIVFGSGWGVVGIKLRLNADEALSVRIVVIEEALFLQQCGVSSFALAPTAGKVFHCGRV